MTGSQIFNFLKKFAPQHDVKVILENKRVGALNILPVAWRLWRGVPVAKIINQKWFYGMRFYTNRHTLDPRPDSETLIDAVLSNEPGARRILDLGTGTGCLLSAILKNLPGAAGVGIDKSRAACQVARRNVKSLGLAGRAEIKRGKFKDFKAGGFDLIVSNPPYIPVGDFRVDKGARQDPKSALYGGADGLKYYRQIAKIRGGAKIYIEIGAGQAAPVRKIFEREGWRFAAQYKDLASRVRVFSFTK